MTENLSSVQILTCRRQPNDAGTGSFWNSSQEELAIAWSHSNVGEYVHAKFDEQSSGNLCPLAADKTT